MEGILWITVTIAFFAFSIAHVRFRDFVLIEGMGHNLPLDLWSQLAGKPAI
jgi:hypothetical protein